MTSSAPVDLGDLEATRAWVDAAAAAYGGIDVLFNNASSPRVGPFVEMTAEDWHYTIRNELDLCTSPRRPCGTRTGSSTAT